MKTIFDILRQAGVAIMLIVTVIATMATLLRSFAYLLTAGAYDRLSHASDAPWWHETALTTHIAAAIGALLVGPPLLSARFRRFAPDPYRLLLALYLIWTAVSGMAALALTPYVGGGSFARIGFLCLTIVWLAATLAAALRFRQLALRSFQRRIVLSYALTLSGVSMQAQLASASLLVAAPIDQIYPVIAWTCWLPNLLIALLLTCRRR